MKRIRLSPHRWRGERRFMKTVFAESTNPKTRTARLAAIEDGIRRFRIENYRFPALYREIQQNIIAHPNVPLEVLFPNSPAIDDKLIATYPDAFLGNPVVPLLALERPDYLQRLNKATILRLLARANAPESFVALASSHADESIRYAALQHIRKVGEFVSEDLWEEARRDFITKLPLPEAWNDRFEDNYEALWGLAEISPERNWLAEYLKERIGLPWWRRPRENNTRWDLRYRAEDSSTPSPILLQFGRSNDPGIWSAVYRNPNISKAIRDAVLQNLPGYPQNTSEPTLLNYLYLAQAGRDLQREALSEEYRILRLVLTKEENPLDSPYPATRLARALNPATPRHILQILATQEGHRIVRAAARVSLNNRSAEGTRD